ncbi:hypothetical protein CAPTEDRAFT_93602 [Capitella teleta]|uniref:PDZ domain-containing protein n=1 Tax=Capitella teleta TaxID=283909 RepID=R7ULG4_CAPTE|nr:hypothetical protein CAPTEDRAFT_93602 [Capitella teleta]|eukprot:ELU04102.1 hypothetical protein CAPTEDRAFT_93602 [Capitella teleta]
MNHIKCKRFATAFVSSCVGLAVLQSFVSDFSVKKATSLLPVLHAEDLAPPKSNRQKWNFLSECVEKAMPALVHIQCEPPNNGQPFSHLHSTGSGFIIREDGLIVTNAHIVRGMKQVLVKIHDGKIYYGLVIAVDHVSDLAAIKIEAKNLPTLKLGDSKDVRAGEWVVALGSPFDLVNSAAAGIVSSVARGSEELGLQKAMEYIQSDVIIDFGNSGGPLVNLDGEAIGMNNMKGPTGISFSIPSNYIKDFVERAKVIDERSDNTQKQCFFLGVDFLTLTPNIIPELQTLRPDFPHDLGMGVVLIKVARGSPAFRYGLRPLDVITSINGQPIKVASEVTAAIASGQQLKIQFRRGQLTYETIVVPQPQY